MSLPQAVINRDGTAVLTFPYCRELVDDIKRTLMSHQRTYNPDTKSWTVTPGSATVAISLLRRYFGHDVVVTDLRNQQTPNADQRAKTFAALHLLPTAPPELVKTAYKTLALLSHPDRPGGDGEQMRALNASYEALQEAGAA